MLGPGEPVGGVAVLERRPYPASAQAMEASAILQIAQEAILAAAARQPSIVQQLSRVISERLRAAHQAVTSLAVDPAGARIAARLLQLAERDGAPTGAGMCLPYRLTRQGLADMAETTVETTIRAVGRWQRAGLVEDQAGHLVVVDLEKLRAIAEGTSP